MKRYNKYPDWWKPNENSSEPVEIGILIFEFVCCFNVSLISLKCWPLYFGIFGFILFRFVHFN